MIGVEKFWIIFLSLLDVKKVIFIFKPYFFVIYFVSRCHQVIGLVYVLIAKVTKSVLNHSFNSI